MKIHFTPPKAGRPSEKGQSLVELAVSLVFMVTLLAGIIDLGLAFINFVAMRDAAQEGAVYGSIHPTDCATIEAHARESATTFLTGVQVEVLVGGASCAASNPKACAGNEIQVTVSQPEYPISMPFLSAILNLPGNTLNLRAVIKDTILSPYTCP